MFKSTIAPALIVILLLSSSVNFHAYSHIADDSEVNCELCEFLSNSVEFEFINSGIFHSEKNTKEIHYKPQAIAYNSPLEKIVTPAFVYNKPPPFV